WNWRTSAAWPTSPGATRPGSPGGPTSTTSPARASPGVPMPEVPGMQCGQVPPLVLFDLDGTLLDSAPDFVATIAVLRSRHGRPSMPEAQLRPHVSRGSRAMLKAAFPDFDED